MGQELKTFARSTGDKIEGVALGLAGTFIGIVGIGVGFLILINDEPILGVFIGLVISMIGLIMVGIGAQKNQKADHVAWTREAIERQSVIDNKGLVCPTCKAVHERGAKFCSKCGRGLAGTCKHCGYKMDFDADFCTHCGLSENPE